MCLRFMFLLTRRLAAWLRLARREETWKTAEILILRHQLAVLQRRQPRRRGWTGRTGHSRDPARDDTESPPPRAALLVTPDTILRWHREIARRRWAARSMRGKTGRPPAGTSGAWSPGCPVKTPLGYRRIHGELAGLGVRVAAVDGIGDPEEGRHRSGAAAGRSYLVAVPALPGRGGPGLRLLHSGPARWHPGLCPDRDRARHQAHPRFLGVTVHPTGAWTAQQAAT
jgi:hypothetical protein